MTKHGPDVLLHSAAYLAISWSASERVCIKGMFRSTMASKKVSARRKRTSNLTLPDF